MHNSLEQRHGLSSYASPTQVLCNTSAPDPVAMCGSAGEVNVFDTRYDIQWVVDGRLTGDPINLPRTELFRKKPVVTKPIIKAWLPEVATCETIQVLPY